MNINELAGKIEAYRTEIKGIFDAKPDMNFSEDELSTIRQKNAELSDLQKRYDSLQEAAALKSQNEVALSELIRTPAARVELGNGARDNGRKSFGELFTCSNEYKAALKSGRVNGIGFELAGVNLKTVMSTSAGYAPESTRTGIVVDSRKVLTIADLITSYNTNSPLIKYMELTTRTNNAAPVAEGAAKPESALALTERNAPLEVIAHFIPVTQQQMEDVDGLMSFLNDQLSYMLREKEEDQLLNGNGTSPQLKGILSAAINTQAQGTDNVPDAIFKGITLVRTNGKTVANAVALNPSDWEGIRLMKDANNNYIFGAPSQAGDDRIFGYQVVQSDFLAAKTVLVGDFSPKSVAIWRKLGIRVDVSNSHSDYFANNQLAVRVEERIAQTVLRPAGFTKVTLV